MLRVLDTIRKVARMGRVPKRITASILQNAPNSAQGNQSLTSVLEVRHVALKADVKATNAEMATAEETIAEANAIGTAITNPTYLQIPGGCHEAIQ